MTGCVLVVDDELPNRLIMRKILGSKGCEVLEAADGQSACRIAREQLPELILVDVMMPEMDGYEVCRRLKENEVTREIAVIMVTARTGIEDIERGFDVGAMDYIRKPFNPRELLVRVRNALQLKQSTDALRRWKEQMSRELELAGVLQRTLLDTEPFLTPDLHIRTTCRPSMNVGGDLLDVLHLGDGRVCFYVGDICGHGVAPAIVSSMLKATLVELISLFGASGPTAVCNELDTRFRQHIANPALYATFFLAIYDAATRRLDAFCCGHPPPIVLDASGGATTDIFEAGGGMPIGFALAEPASYKEEDAVTLTMPSGGNLLVYTDGLTEASMGEGGEECGISRLVGIFRRVTAGAETVNVPDVLFVEIERQGFLLDQDDCSALVLHAVDPATVLLDVDIETTKDALQKLSEDIEKKLLAVGWDAAVAGAVQLLVMEHGENVIDHGNPPANSAISVQLRDEGKRCALLFHDSGSKWDVEARYSRAAPASDYAERGRGLMIINAIADSVEVYRQADKNVALYTVRRELNLDQTG